MPIISHVLDIVSICAANQLKNVVISPGSRNAALTIAFTSHPAFSCFPIADERVAAYTALGMALTTNQPTILICTSGTAALNYVPAVAEAFFLEVPLLLLTADRPAEWINQYDGQTIFQNQVFGNHVKRAYQLPAVSDTEDTDWYINRIFNEGIHLANTSPKGPIHFNVPIREPFYPAENELINFEPKTKINFGEKTSRLTEATWQQILSIFDEKKRVAIAVGQNNSSELREVLLKIQEEFQIPIIADSISNVVGAAITAQDVSIKVLPQIDLLLTTGKSFISKNIKIHFRKERPRKHWHIQQTSMLYDPFQSVTDYFEVNEITFFNELYEKLKIHAVQFPKLKNELQSRNQQLIQLTDDYFLNQAFSDLHCFHQLVSTLPDNILLHSGNSMSIRYLNIFTYLFKKNQIVYCNRGTSGIDGSLSTAVGQAMQTDKPTFCILGDVSFQYDKNALWNENLPQNLKIIVVNNQGGNIFRMIPGPKQQQSFKTFFETNQPLTAEFVAETFSISYLKATNFDELKSQMNTLIHSTETTILEFFTNPETNEKSLKEFRNFMNSQF